MTKAQVEATWNLIKDIPADQVSIQDMGTQIVVRSHLRPGTIHRYLARYFVKKDGTIVQDL